MTYRIVQGDALAVLRTMKDSCVNCCVTSPPYYGLRDYGVDGQIGLEESPQAYVDSLALVFREVRRVLREDGTLWLNLGDSYAGSGRGGNPDAGTKQGTNSGSQSVGVLYGREQSAATQERTRIRAQFSALSAAGIKAKELIGIPWRVALALQADGWYLRQDIIWHKPNPMPESVQDRCTKAHEYLFLLSKSAKYYFDNAAIQEPATGRSPGNKKHKFVDKYNNDNSEQHRTAAGLLNIGKRDTRNRRSVWTVSTVASKIPHFAMFPPALIEPCIRAGCPEQGVVIDPFGGVGTTALVAEGLGRHSVCIELSPAHVAMATARLAQESYRASY